AVWLLSRLADQRSLLSACAAGAAIGLATLARFPSGALWIAALLLLLCTRPLPGTSRWRAWRRAAGLQVCLTGAMLAVLFPWILRNWMLWGQPILTPHFVGQYFYTSNGPGIEMERDGYYSPQEINYPPPERPEQVQKPWSSERFLFS